MHERRLPRSTCARGKHGVFFLGTETQTVTMTLKKRRNKMEETRIQEQPVSATKVQRHPSDVPDRPAQARRALFSFFINNPGLFICSALALSVYSYARCLDVQFVSHEPVLACRKPCRPRSDMQLIFSNLSRTTGTERTGREQWR